MKEGGKILSKIFKELKKRVKPGVSKKDLEKEAFFLIKKSKVKPSFLGHKNYPSCICISINEELVHGIPNNQKIKKGDLVSLDLGIRHKGLCLDKAETIKIRDRDRGEEKFLKVVKKSLKKGILKAKVNNHLGDISYAVQKEIEKGGFSVVRVLSGHGVGREVHEKPQIPNFGEKGKGIVLKKGMILAIEPMAAMDAPDLITKKDGFTIQSKDGSKTCHFEETVAITKKGPLVLTK